MSETIKAEVAGDEALMRFWGQYFPEIPVCSHPDCGGVAKEVDSFFPYIDDLNRCAAHPHELTTGRKWSAPGCARRVSVSSTHRRGNGRNTSLAPGCRKRPIC